MARERCAAIPDPETGRGQAANGVMDGAQFDYVKSKWDAVKFRDLNDGRSTDEIRFLFR